MRPIRTGGGGFGSFFPTGGMAFKLAAALVICSVLTAVLGRQGLAEWLVLTPALVVSRFALWELVSYAFIEVHPMGVIFGGIILWSIGGSLETTWGSRRLLLFVLTIAVAAAALTVLFAFLSPSVMAAAIPGGGVMTTAVWLGYGWAFGGRQTNFWGIPLTGNMLAGIGILFVVLNALMASWVAVLPEIFSIPLVYGYVRYGSPSDWMTRLRGWSLQRRLRARSRHLKVVEKDRNVGGGSDRYLH